ncbi:CRISPR-associated (Cas) DxTHG family protein [Anaerobranca californiensis DSM 14826]|jgi:cell division protein DivIC|uniref:CRISPR-associated (Cas) DxTHG family protein n=1 Tax=Anaerobranca californiensis DSM 14826 TaxID=1120989 RepID=A0A1M6QK12_9FIRM|nr:hypothetical protein [Anaerobranca californiensis]SHK20571.1 CRISPR-associated (Cas) DxTHG family protein [Anaerobranca californiensis DSM 14826]
MEKTIVFSFIGKARKNNGPGYQKTSYFFQERNKVWEDSFFGNALVNELDDRGVTIDKWVIIGTPTSTWSEIIGVIADKVEFNEELTDIWHQVENEQEKGLSEETLKKWQNLINENMLKIKEINFHLVEP